MNTAPTKYYLIHVYGDKEHKQHIQSIHNGLKNRKSAVKVMRDQMHKDLVSGKYYFYVVVEQTNKIIDFAPNHETTD
jgi:hypothetical protein